MKSEHNGKNILIKIGLEVFFLVGGLLFFSFCRQKTNYPPQVCKTGSVEIAGHSYDIVTFGSFPQSKSNDDNTFIEEPITWRVVEKKQGKALLVSEKVLFGGVPFYEHYTSDRTIENKIIYANNYEHSEIRAYLNGLSFVDLKKTETKWENNGFLQKAFTEAEQEIIAVTKVDNSIKQMNLKDKPKMEKDYSCQNTLDKVFLLSEYEINNPKYGFINDETRIRGVTDYGINNQAWSSKDKNGIWWLRTPYYQYASRGMLITYTGKTEEQTNRVRDTGTGIVPAIWINLE